MNVDAILAVAAHPTTERHEAINALNMLHKAAVREKKTLSALLTGGHTTINVTPVGVAPVATYLRRIDELETKNAALSEKVVALKDEIRNLNGRIATLNKERRDVDAQPQSFTAEDVGARAKPTGKTCPYHAFEEAVKTRLGRGHGWKTIFAKKTGLTTGHIYQWRGAGKVPAEIMALVSELDVVGPRRKNSRFSEAEIARARELFQQPLKIREIRDILSQEFGREVEENSVKGLKTRLAKMDG
jgi:hypothetical protein